MLLYTLRQIDFKPSTKYDGFHFQICITVFKGDYFGNCCFYLTNCPFFKRKKNPRPGDILAVREKNLAHSP